MHILHVCNYRNSSLYRGKFVIFWGKGRSGGGEEGGGGGGWLGGVTSSRDLLGMISVRATGSGSPLFPLLSVGI